MGTVSDNTDVETEVSSTTPTTSITTTKTTGTPTEIQCPVPEIFYSFSGRPATSLADCYWDFNRCFLSPSCCNERWQFCGNQVVRYQAQSFSSHEAMLFYHIDIL